MGSLIINTLLCFFFFYFARFILLGNPHFASMFCVSVFSALSRVPFFYWFLKTFVLYGTSKHILFHGCIKHLETKTCRFCLQPYMLDLIRWIPNSLKYWKSNVLSPFGYLMEISNSMSPKAFDILLTMFSPMMTILVNVTLFTQLPKSKHCSYPWLHSFLQTLYFKFLNIFWIGLLFLKNSLHPYYYQCFTFLCRI